MQWYAAFHNTTHHPHIHLMVYSKDTKQGYLTNKGIEDMRGVFAKDIFRNEMYYAFTLETQMRGEVRVEAKKKIDELLRDAETPSPASDGIQILYVKLIGQLSNYKGKKVYGYLPKNLSKQSIISLLSLQRMNGYQSYILSGTKRTVKSCLFITIRKVLIFRWKITKNLGISKMRLSVLQFL